MTPPEAPPKYLDCVLITGASAGLGEEYARQLAPLSKHLVLIARRQEKLVELGKSLKEIHPNLKVSCFSADLALEGDRTLLFDHLEKESIIPNLLVNNAGLGDYGEFIHADWEKVKSMLDVNVTALTELTFKLLPKMIEQDSGAIINVSSIASLIPIPDFAVYAATKAYVTSFSEALNIELKEFGIPVLTVCPGPIKTEFGEVASREDTGGFNPSNSLYVEKETVVTDSLVALFREQPRIYPGLKIALMATAVTLLPLCVVRLVMSRRPRKQS